MSSLTRGQHRTAATAAHEEVARQYDRIAWVYNIFDRIERVPEGLRCYAANALCAPHRSGVVAPRRFLEVGCGTGRNIPFVHSQMGSYDEYIGIDISRNMLARAEKLRTKNKWQNVLLFEMDAAQYGDSIELDGVLCSLCLCQMQDHEAVLRNLWQYLRPGARLVILDAELQAGRHWEIAAPVISCAMRGLCHSDMRIKPWQSFKNITNAPFVQILLGNWGFYVAWAEKP